MRTYLNLSATYGCAPCMIAYSPEWFRSLLMREERRIAIKLNYILRFLVRWILTQAQKLSVNDPNKDAPGEMATRDNGM